MLYPQKTKKMKNLKIAFRNILKSKVVSVINLLGLTLGIVISILLLSYVRQEKNTDTFIKDYNDIYRLGINNEGSPVARPMIDLFRNRFPEIPITYCSKDWAGQVFLMDESGNSFKVNHLLNTDSAFFNVFQFEMAAGNAQNALDVTSKIVLKESLARRIFGNQDPIGKMLRLNTSYYSDEPVEVSAVLKEFPENTSWQIDAISSVYLNDKRLTWYAANANRWGGRNYWGFCKLPSNVNPDDIKTQLTALSQSAEVIDNTEGLGFTIKPFSQVYFHEPSAELSPPKFKTGNLQTMNALELIAALILLMACINYVNLVSAQRQKRNKSVAVIKMLGSQTWGVVQIFMLEAGLMLLAVLGLCIVLMPFALQFFNGLMETNYTTSLFLETENIVMAVVILSFTFLITGLLPGLMFSRYKALRLIKPMAEKHKEGFFRNALPVLQFSIAIGLIACLFTIKKQNDMMLAKNPGYEREHVMYANVNSDVAKQSQALLSDFKNISGIADITFASHDLVKVTQNWGANLVYDGKERMVGFDAIGVSSNFFDFFGMKLVQGHNFIKREYNIEEIIFNQTAIHEFGIADIGEAKIMGDGSIIGVVEDFNLRSAHTPIAPVGFYCNGETGNYIYLKTNTQNYEQLKTLIAQVDQKWNKLSPNIPFEYKFLDEEWDNLYKKETQFQKLLSHAGWISIFIACLGLFGLSMFVTERRTKEIGIRKINGATITEILTLLNKSFVKWIIIAFVIATPLAYYAMSKWLENFAYKTELSWWIFALAGLASLFVALITVSWQSWRAASRNPVEALRYE